MRIDVTHIDKKELIKKAYELSKSQRMGFIHYQSGGLTDDEAEEIIAESCNKYPPGNIYLDYVKGRSLKFSIYKEGDKFYINSSWYDHTDAQMKELLKHFGIEMEIKNEHGCCCECDDCLEKNNR